MRCGHIQGNVSEADITQRHVVILWRRDQVLNPFFDLLAKTTGIPDLSGMPPQNPSVFCICVCVRVYGGLQKKKSAFIGWYLSTVGTSA